MCVWWWWGGAGVGVRLCMQLIPLRAVPAMCVCMVGDVCRYQGCRCVGVMWWWRPLQWCTGLQVHHDQGAALRAVYSATLRTWTACALSRQAPAAPQPWPHWTSAAAHAPAAAARAAGAPRRLWRHTEPPPWAPAAAAGCGSRRCGDGCSRHPCWLDVSAP